MSVSTALAAAAAGAGPAAAGVSGWVQQLVPAGAGLFVCTGASICGKESLWSVSSAEVKKLRDLDSPAGQGCRLCRHPKTGQFFGTADAKLLELDLDLERGSSAWEVVRVVGSLSVEGANGACPFVSAEGRLYAYSRAGLQEFVVNP